MHALKPITLAELVEGQDYIFVYANLLGEIGISTFTLLGSPYSAPRNNFTMNDDGAPKIDFLLLPAKSKGPLDECTYAYAEALGLVEENWPLDHNRVFPCTDSAHEVLSRFAEERDIVSYLHVINFPNPEEAIIAYHTEIEETERFWNELPPL